MDLINLLALIIFIVGSIICFRRYILNNSTFMFLIGCNSMVAGFGVVKEYIPTKEYSTYTIIRIISGLSVLLIVHLLKRRQTKKDKNPFNT